MACVSLPDGVSPSPPWADGFSLTQQQVNCAAQQNYRPDVRDGSIVRITASQHRRPLVLNEQTFPRDLAGNMSPASVSADRRVTELVWLPTLIGELRLGEKDRNLTLRARLIIRIGRVCRHR